MSKLCEEATGGGAGGGGRDAEPKTRTPHKDVGNKEISQNRFVFKLADRQVDR